MIFGRKLDDLGVKMRSFKVKTNITVENKLKKVKRYSAERVKTKKTKLLRKENLFQNLSKNVVRP
jgi:hypothetical protein